MPAERRSELRDAKPGTVIQFDCKLMRLSRPGSDRPWVAQDGTTWAVSDFTRGVTIMWSPDA